MIKALGEPLVLFMIPFGLYAGFLLAQLINPFSIDPWTRRVVVPLALLGTVLAVGSLVLYGLFADRYEGGYRPAHIENGRVVPGRMAFRRGREDDGRCRGGAVITGSHSMGQAFSAKAARCFSPNHPKEMP